MSHLVRRHLSVVIVADQAGRTLRPTVRSVLAAGARAVDSGHHVDVLIITDPADAHSGAEAVHWVGEQGSGVAVTWAEVGLDDGGAARNAGVNMAGGEIIALLDGQDLISSGFLVQAMATLDSAVGQVIVHPEAVLDFGSVNQVWTPVASTSGTRSYLDLIAHDLWPSAAVAYRRAFEQVPARLLPHASGFGPADWVWNIDTVVAGFGHVVAPKSLLFRRRRGVHSRPRNHAIHVLPPVDMDALRRRLPVGEDPASERVEPPTTAPIPGPVARLRRAISVRLTGAERARWSRLARRLRRLVTGVVDDPPPSAPASLALRYGVSLEQAVHLDPAISWAAMRIDELPRWDPVDNGFASIIDTTLAALGGLAEAIVAVPWLGIGGGDLAALNYAKALQASTRFRGRTAILATYLSEKTVPEVLPDDVAFVQMPQSFYTSAPALRQRLTAQLIALANPTLLISVNCFHITDSLQLFSASLGRSTDLYLSFFALGRLDNGFPSSPMTEDGLRPFLDAAAGVLTDNSITARQCSEILALDAPFVRVHRQPAMDLTPELMRSSPAIDDEDFTPASPFRVVWPHRLDREKRPDTVLRIARELSCQGAPVSIDVWGSPVISIDADAIIKELEEAGVRYRGPYSGGLQGLPFSEYHALLLTSENEGLPLVLVQSLLLGLPVVASDVGGVGDLIVDGQTGILARGPDDVPGFVDGLVRLMQSRELRRSVIETGYARAVADRSREAFQRTVEDDLVSLAPRRDPRFRAGARQSRSAASPNESAST